MRKEKKVKVNGAEYVVREISIGEMMPLLPRLSGDEANEAQLDIVKKCVYVNGHPIGDAASELGLSEYLELAGTVMAVNGLAEGKG